MIPYYPDTKLEPIPIQVETTTTSTYLDHLKWCDKQDPKPLTCELTELPEFKIQFIPTTTTLASGTSNPTVSGTTTTT